MRASRYSLLSLVVVGCVAEVPPPPSITVTSPARKTVQGQSGMMVVTGTTRPGTSGSRVAKVRVNDVQATLSADGSFTASIMMPPGASLIESVAIAEDGGVATDARAVQIGELRPVGSNIDRAVTATLSADAFAKLSAAAGPILEATNFTSLLAPLQPMARLGTGSANVQLSVSSFTLGDAKIVLKPVDGGLEFSAELGGIAVAASAVYGGTFVPDGTTTVRVGTDKVTIGGTLVFTPAGAGGFAMKIQTPTVRTGTLNLESNGLVGSVLEVMNDNLGSTVQKIVTSNAEKALEPLLNKALGALGGPKRLAVLDEVIEVEATPAALTFTRAGALVSMNVKAMIAGAESSPGFVYTPNGTPTLDVGTGVQVAIADDLVNEMLAEVHALGVLNLQLPRDFGYFDMIDLELTMPPMVSANNTDGTLRLVLGDVKASVSNDGKKLVGASINAQVDVEVKPGTNPQEIALKFGELKLFVNLETDPEDDNGLNIDMFAAARAGINLQLDSLEEVLISAPVPSVAGLTLDTLALRADSGYVVASGQIH